MTTLTPTPTPTPTPNSNPTPQKLAPPGRRRERRAAELEARTRTVAERLGAIAAQPTSQVLKEYGVDRDGLCQAEVLDRQERHGLNTVAQERAPRWYVQLAKAYANPFIAVLVFLAAVMYWQDPADPGVIILSVMVGISGLLRFWQEFRSGRAADALKQLVTTTTAVQRRAGGAALPTTVEVPMDQVVPGDVVKLGAGDLIPADLRLITAKDLMVSQAALSGESLPVAKADVRAGEDNRIAASAGDPVEAGNLCLMGTSVTSGTATGVVVATGADTYFGSMAGSLVGERPQTNFDTGVRRVSFLLIRFMLVMVPVVFMINGFTKGDWNEAFLFAIAVAVGLTPEMLPMVVSANLARGAVAMSKKKVVVKRLNAIQNLGAMDVLCTDKTGTLTEDRIVLDRYLDVHGTEDNEVLEYGYLNAHFQTGLRNLMDQAVIDRVNEAEEVVVDARFTMVDEIPFDFARRRMSVVLNRNGLLGGAGRPEHVLITKGAVEEVLALCTHLMDRGERVELTDQLRWHVTRTAEDIPGAPAPDRRIRVPGTLARDGYGWAEFIRHRYCADEAELAAFYRNLGHWLAVLRFTGGTDMHAENMIAAGPVPVIVDAETLFDAPAPFPPSGRGDAVDAAAAAIRRTVLRTGLLPVRGTGFALGGVDISGIGALPGQQPLIPHPVIADGGTAAARFEVDLVAMPVAGNHPAATPVLSTYWDRVLAGFREMTAHLRRPGLDPHRLLARFEGTRARRILRPTQAYVDIGRMLWHPASLHDEPAAIERARDILRRNADALPGAPTDRVTIDGEIADLLVGDVPMFGFTVDAPAVRATVADWRGADLAFEESVIQDALVGAYLNERSLPARVQAAAHDPHARDRERRRRALAAQMVRGLCDGAVRGEDGTVTWISPVFTPAGWSIRVLPADLYTGQGGVALTLAEYDREVRAGRAEQVPGVRETFEGALRVLIGTEGRTPTPSAGAFSGAASQVWTWLALHRVRGEDWLLRRAAERALLLTAGPLVDEDVEVDLLNGAAGAIVPLLDLATATGQARWLDAAAHIGHRLAKSGVSDAGGVRWPTRLNPEGIGGFAHGATGIGWALTRLALSQAGSAAERADWSRLGERAFAFQESLYRPVEGNWLDVRIGAEEDFFTSWCHGSAGIGIGMLDLHRRTGDPAHLDMARRAAGACAAEGFGWSHTLCHGDLGLWEFLTSIGSGAPEDLDAEILTGLEQRGPVGGLAREAFSPSLMSGLAGVLHTLLRMHPDADLPNPLLLD
ncbi:type 2 lanthipeptide synthetase LanM [Streptomyces sp. NPDC048491]|uniref:type 2 lanthipeptide synthetase LanM n=1 Tax=Streptomyces sp. NPDC048491 TaxID=3157207 RepID=UPI0034319755